VRTFLFFVIRYENCCVMRAPCLPVLGRILRYSPEECVEGEFYEFRLEEVLRSWCLAGEFEQDDANRHREVQAICHAPLRDSHPLIAQR
jgi:hypothetical protein